MHNNEKMSIINRISSFSGSLISIVFWLTLIFGFEETSMAISTIIAATIHETGHVLFLKYKGKKLSLKGVLSGFRIKSDDRLSYPDETGLYLSGPAANILCCFILIPAIGYGKHYLGELMIANMITAMSNLMPIEGYDGYGAIRSIIRQHEDDEKYEKILRDFSFTFVFVLCVFSLYFIDRFGGGYWIFAIFFLSAVKEMSKRLKNINFENL